MIELKTLKTKNLTKELIIDICKLKDSHWKFGFVSQKKWFEKNNNLNDLHNFFFYKNKLAGYTSLKKKIFYLEGEKKIYLLFDTLIVDKKFRNLKIGKILMNFNNYIIENSTFPSFLLCNDNIINFYKKFKWKKLNNKIEIKNDLKKFLNKKFLSYNLDNNKLKKKKLILEI